MNVQQLMERTLHKLDRPTDSHTLALYQERLLGYLNEAMLDLTAELRPWRQDTVQVADAQADLNTLPRTCVKVLAARRNGERRLFYYGPTRWTLLFPGVPDGPMEIVYRYQPQPLSELTDEPELPEELQALLVEYAAARERSRFDAASQNAARLDLTLYKQLVTKLRRGYPAPDLSQIYHIY